MADLMMPNTPKFDSSSPKTGHFEAMACVESVT